MKSIFLMLIAFHANASLKTLTYGKDIHAREAHAAEYDKASTQQSHSDFEFKIDDHATVVGPQIQLGGTLKNTAPVKKLVYIVGDSQTLKIQIENMKFKPTAPKPPVPPPMFALEVPAKSEVKFTGTQNLDELDYTGSPDVKIKWIFQYWTSPKPAGEVTFKMPTAAEAKVLPLKVTIKKFSADDAAKIIASLVNVSNDPQIFCHSEPNFSWSLSHEDGSGIEVVEVLNIEYEPHVLSAGDCFVIKPNESKEVGFADLKKNGETFDLAAGDTYKNLTKGKYRLHFTATNGAASGDPKMVEAVRAKAHAAKPTPVVELDTTIEIP